MVDIAADTLLVELDMVHHMDKMEGFVELDMEGFVELDMDEMEGFVENNLG